eukprot:TRINITY_DN13408_c1_g1_i1.p1 TRINITY_DN13408_c1_g1~~TRINITY_DN13408_c1_g1_i1.p1  ORF type:complete len:440 (-),score=144.81 TRINITY_DN13408_c1_g1_i1:93-1412(-)
MEQQQRAASRLNKVREQIGSGNQATAAGASIIPQLSASSAPSPAPSDDDVVIIAAVRTPITKAKRGGFKDTHWTDLLSVVLKEVVQRAQLPGPNPTDHVQDVQVGTVLAAGGGATQARMALYLAGFNDSTSVATLNRQCSSGLQAIATVAGLIKTGAIDMGIAAGVESMSTNDMMSAVGALNDRVFQNERAQACLLPMGITSENVAEKFGVSRAVQDEFALQSQLKAAKAQQNGLFKDEIVAVQTKIVNEDGSSKNITVDSDDGIRGDTTLASLTKLRPAFKKDGSTTAGNSSQVSDGAAAVLMCSRRKAKQLGLKPQLRVRSFAVVGVPPEVMGIGPAFAIPEALKKANLTTADVDLYEINEAFASQAAYSVQKLGLDPAKVNPLGGAIALGHPLGCTGARQVASVLQQLKRTGGKYACTSMCIGTGMGAAAVFEREN